MKVQTFENNENMVLCDSQFFFIYIFDIVVYEIVYYLLARKGNVHVSAFGKYSQGSFIKVIGVQYSMQSFNLNNERQ